MINVSLESGIVDDIYFTRTRTVQTDYTPIVFMLFMEAKPEFEPCNFYHTDTLQRSPTRRIKAWP